MGQIRAHDDRPSIFWTSYFQKKKHDKPFPVGKSRYSLGLVICEKIWDLRQALQKPRRFEGILGNSGPGSIWHFAMNVDINGIILER
jgi:hypothetical protein